jgi:WD40 repeat protein
MGFTASGKGGPVAWSADSARVAGTCKEVARVWSVSTGKCLHELTGHEFCFELVWNDGSGGGDGETLASGGSEGGVRVWDASSGACRRILTHKQ